jgi:hypothetical protein
MLVSRGDGTATTIAGWSAAATSNRRAQQAASKKCLEGRKWSWSWERWDVAESMNLEDRLDQLAKKHDLAIFCSFPRNCTWAMLGTPGLLAGALSTWGCGRDRIS